jgi:tRNA threonylcarbamoyladenosine biosynthesis protein TsaE
MNSFNPNFISHSLEETSQWGASFAQHLKAGDLVGFVGDLGAGKTQLIKTICGCYGVPMDQVTSPTFTLVNEYQGKEKIFHMDVYRLNHLAEFESLDLDYYLKQNGIILIEWADIVAALLPPETLWLKINCLGKNERSISFRKEWHAPAGD